jgi:hypothetical protein
MTRSQSARPTASSRQYSANSPLGRAVSLALLLGLLPLGALFLATGCKKRSPPAPERPTASAPPVPSATPPVPRGPVGNIKPVGPRQVVVPGKGITAIRFGATTETIERHMQAPCDVKTETRCLYVMQALDFTLEKGVLVRARAERRDRPVPGAPDRAFGTFYGGMAPDITMGLHRHIVHEEFGQPERSEAFSPSAGLGLTHRDFYSGLTLEYDRISNGNEVLSAMEVFPAENPATPRPAGKQPVTGAVPPTQQSGG